MTTTKIVLGYLISCAGLHVMPEALGEIKKFLDELFASRYDIDFIFCMSRKILFGEEIEIKRLAYRCGCYEIASLNDWNGMVYYDYPFACLESGIV